MKQKKNLRQIFSVFLTCMMIIGVALVNDHIFVEGEGKPQAEQQVQEQQEPGEQEQGDPEKPGEQEQKPGQGEIQEGKPQQEPEQGQELGQGQGDSGKPGELPGKPGEQEVKLRGEPKELEDITITKFELQEDNGKPIPEGTQYGYWNKYRLFIEWSAKAYGDILKEGDYFIVKLPKEFKFPKDGPAIDFNLLTKDKKDVLATAHVDSNGESGGGTIKVTFTKYVEGKPDITGDLYVEATFAYNNISELGGMYTITVGVGKNNRSIDIRVKRKPVLIGEYFTKWGEKTGNDKRAKWVLRINHKKDNYTNLVISDKLSVDSGDLPLGICYLPETFLLQEVNYDEYGGTHGKFIEQYGYNKLKDYIDFSENNTKFEFRFKDMLGATNGKQYLFTYETTYIPGLKLNNSATFNSVEENTPVQSYFRDAQSGGGGQSDLRGRIKITKIDADNNNVFLQGAEFLIIDATGKEIGPLITNQNGEAISDKLNPGDYKVKEMKAPSDEYLLDETVRDVTVKANEPVFLVFKNKSAVTIKATKKWVDNGFTGAKKEVFFRLLGDGNPVPDTTKAVSPTNEVEWKVRKYNNQGIEIEYTVEEVDKDGAPWKEQNWTTSGPVKDKNSGKFIITNTYNSPNPGGGGSGGGQSGGGSGGTGGDDSNKPKPNDPKPNNPKPNGPTPSDDSTGMGGATPPDSSVMPDGSVVPNDSTTATNTVAPKNQKMPKNPVLTDKQGVKKTAQASRRLPKTGEGANPTLYAWMLGALGSMLVLVGYRKRKTVK